MRITDKQLTRQLAIYNADRPDHEKLEFYAWHDHRAKWQLMTYNGTMVTRVLSTTEMYETLYTLNAIESFHLHDRARRERNAA